MTMTHYMELLATAQPWHLLIFMALPVVLAETIAVTELHILFTRDFKGIVRKLNRAAGMLLGVYFTGIFAYLLLNAVVPLTQSGEWRGIADIVAVFSYLAGVVPLGGIALLEFGLLAKGKNEEEKLRLHATFVAIFLVVAHIAMIFGMLNPEVLGWNGQTASGMHM